MTLTDSDFERLVEAIKKAPESQHEAVIRFFTSCCKHCQMADLSCSAYMLCECHYEQIEELKKKLGKIMEAKA